MPGAGKLVLNIIWDGRGILGVGVKSTRPKAYRILEGRIPDNVVQLVPLLFSVCGKAQQAAAIAAVSAAQGYELPQNKNLERRVTCEVVQEHLWRLLLDWPERLGLEQHRQQFVLWHHALNEIAAGQGNAQVLADELCRILLGMKGNDWNRVDSRSRLGEWQKAGQGLLTPVFSALDKIESGLDFGGEMTDCSLLPIWTAADASQIYAGQLGQSFAAKPQFEGKPMETGALAYCQPAALLQDVLQQRPRRLSARLIARLADLLDSAEALAQERISGRVSCVSAADAGGVALVRTARGMLMHSVRIETERIAEYLIVAPTEWNFHPQGALVTGLTGLKENDAGRLVETVRHFVLSLDPCVEYEIEVEHA